MIPPLWTAFKDLPWQARIGLVLVPLLGLVLVWASYTADQSAFSADQLLQVRTEGFGLSIGLGAFNMILLYVFALTVERHPEIWKNATVTKDFWKNLE